MNGRDTVSADVRPGAGDRQYINIFTFLGSAVKEKNRVLRERIMGDIL